MTEKQLLIKSILELEFENEAGYLKNFEPFIKLKALIEEEAKEYSVAVLPPLERPICVFDLETTGTDVQNDRIVQISTLKIMPDGTRELKTTNINPGIPIPAAATEVHGIGDDDVKDAPMFVQISKGLLAFIEDCDMIGFNSNKFDVPMLLYSFERVGLTWDWKKVNLIDVRNIYVQKDERSLSAAVKRYVGRDHVNAHNAEADLTATLEVLLGVLGRHDDIPRSMPALALYSNYDREIIDLAGKFKKNDEGEIVFTFGKHIDQPARKHKDFLQWMLMKDFTKDTLRVVNELMILPSK